MAPTGKKRNILLIVADDLGFSDIGAYGSEIHTPNLDALAAEGARLTDFHTAAACSPTRSMLLSGTDAHIAGVGVMAEQRGTNPERWNRPGHEGYLTHRVAALPELLKDAGYQTFMSGKWHLGMQPDYIPAARGFDRSLALLPGASNHYGWEPQLEEGQGHPLLARLPFLYVEDHAKKVFEANKTNDPKGFYSSRTYVDYLIRYLDERSAEHRDKPFFAFLPFGAPHWPLQASKADRDRYLGVYDDGPDALRLKRLTRLRELGLVGDDIVPHDVVADEVAEWDDMTEYEKKCSCRAQETYAAMVTSMDEHLGRVFDYLKRTGQYEDTHIIFMSDNGAEGAALEAKPVMGNFLEVIERYYDNSLENIGEHNSFTWLGPRWAQAATAPSRLYKMWPTEGGIRVPMIIKSPSFDPSLQGGAVVPAFATVMDILPTVLDLIGVEHPVSVGQDRGTYRGRAVERVRGVSWVPYFVDRSTATIHGDGHAGTPHGWELFGRAGLRRGNDKIVHLGYGGRTDAKDWQLFDLAVDPGETRDLAAEKPELLRELLGLWDAYVRETGVAWGAEAMPHGDVDASAFDKSTWVGGDALEHQKAWMKTRKGERPS